MITNSMEFILFTYMQNDVLDGIRCCFSVLLLPHKLINIGTQELTSYPSHPFEFHLGLVPIAFNILSVCPIWCYKSYGVVDGRVLKSQSTLNRAVRSPLIRMYNGARQYILLNDWQQCCCIPCGDETHYSSHWPVRSIH